MVCEFDTLAELLDHHGIDVGKFSRRMGWKQSTGSMKLNRHRPWTIAEYEAALRKLRKQGISISRELMMKFASKRVDDGNA